MNTADFSLRDEGTIQILTPLTDQARDWVTENLPDDAQRFGPGYVIEPRYTGPIVEGLINDGLSVVPG